MLNVQFPAALSRALIVAISDPMIYPQARDPIRLARHRQPQKHLRNIDILKRLQVFQPGIGDMGESREASCPTISRFPARTLVRGRLLSLLRRTRRGAARRCILTFQGRSRYAGTCLTPRPSGCFSAALRPLLCICALGPQSPS